MHIVGDNDEDDSDVSLTTHYGENDPSAWSCVGVDIPLPRVRLIEKPGVLDSPHLQERPRLAMTAEFIAVLKALTQDHLPGSHLPRLGTPPLTYTRPVIPSRPAITLIHCRLGILYRPEIPLAHNRVENLSPPDTIPVHIRRGH